MSDTFGALYMQGNQIGLPGGGIMGIGPFAVPCSGVLDNKLYGVNTTVTVPVATGAAGAIIIPPASGTVSFSYKTVPGDTGIYASPSQPSFLAFDPAHIPSSIYLVSASSVDITVQFI